MAVQVVKGAGSGLLLSRCDVGNWVWDYTDHFNVACFLPANRWLGGCQGFWSPLCRGFLLVMLNQFHTRKDQLGHQAMVPSY